MPGRDTNIGRRAAVGALAATTAGAMAALTGDVRSAGAEASSSVFDPRDFGARFDGSTDDTAAIKAANDAAAAVSGTLWLPSGIAIVSATIPLRSGVAYVGQSREATVLKAAPGKAIGAVMAAERYLANSPWSGPPIRLSGFTIDGNRASGATGSGIIVMNYRSVLTDLRVQEVSGDGIVVSDRTANGTRIANTAVENQIRACWIHSVGGCGILVTDTATSGASTDGYIEGCVISQAGQWALRVERAAGWFIAHNHAYGNLQNGMYLDQLWCTSFHHNEVDHFGVAGGSGTYTGFFVQNIIAGRPSSFSHNFACANENAASTFRYYLLRAPNVDVTVSLWANTAHIDSGAAASSTAFRFIATPGGTLTVRGGASNVVSGPPIPSSVTGNVLFPDGPPGQTGLGSPAAPSADVPDVDGADNDPTPSDPTVPAPTIPLPTIDDAPAPVAPGPSPTGTSPVTGPP